MKMTEQLSLPLSQPEDPQYFARIYYTYDPNREVNKRTGDSLKRKPRYRYVKNSCLLGAAFPNHPPRTLPDHYGLYLADDFLKNNRSKVVVEITPELWENATNLGMIWQQIRDVSPGIPPALAIEAQNVPKVDFAALPESNLNQEFVFYPVSVQELELKLSTDLESLAADTACKREAINKVRNQATTQSLTTVASYPSLWSRLRNFLFGN